VTLQSIVQHEIDEKCTTAKNSATDALMWLRRAIWFLREFLAEFSKSHNPHIHDCVNTSYDRTLKQYHNWVVKGIFSLAIRSLPTTDDFIKNLLNDRDLFHTHKHVIINLVSEDMKKTVDGIDLCIETIKEFYLKNKLEV
jgi:pleckstrin family protein A (phosphoinositide binding specific) protein 8